MDMEKGEMISILSLLSPISSTGRGTLTLHSTHIVDYWMEGLFAYCRMEVVVIDVWRAFGIEFVDCQVVCSDFL